MKAYKFDYSIQGLKNHVMAESVSNAIELAKRAFLKTHYGLDHTNFKFAAKKSGLEVTLWLRLDPMEKAKFRELYRAAKENCLQGEERQEFKQLYTIVNDKRLQDEN